MCPTLLIPRFVFHALYGNEVSLCCINVALQNNGTMFSNRETVLLKGAWFVKQRQTQMEPFHFTIFTIEEQPARLIGKRWKSQQTPCESWSATLSHLGRHSGNYLLLQHILLQNGTTFRGRYIYSRGGNFAFSLKFVIFSHYSTLCSVWEVLS